MNCKPLISVLCSSYNHEKYVEYFINSLLCQTYDNWELLIIDDCSTDCNVLNIRKFKDKRIKFFQQPFNSGSGIVTTRAFGLSKGDIIIDCASDDALRSDYFEKIIQIFNENESVGVIYSSLQIIDYENNFTGHWDLPQWNRIELLQQLFFKGNCLFSPGCAIRRKYYKLLIPMNFALVQHQDYQWHIKLLINTDCELLKDYYVYYRFQNENSISLSGMNMAGKNRYRLEEDYLMNTFLQIDDTKLVERILNFEENYISDKALIPYFFSVEILKSDNLEKRQWGYRTLLNFFSDEKKLEKLHNYNGFEFKDFLNISKNIFFDSSIINNKIKFYDELFYSDFMGQVFFCVKFIFASFFTRLKKKIKGLL